MRKFLSLAIALSLLAGPAALISGASSDAHAVWSGPNGNDGCIKKPGPKKPRTTHTVPR